MNGIEKISARILADAESEAAAIRLAARFVALAAEQTLHAGADPRFGVRFEPLLGTLSHWAETPAQPCTDAVFPL